MGDRLLRAVERWLLPWYDRANAEAQATAAAQAVLDEQRKTERGERLRKDAIAARQESEPVRRAYQLSAQRLERR